MTQQMPQSRPPSAPNIPVTDITQMLTFQPGPDGRPTQGYEISFTTPRNSRGSVFVPMSKYTQANVNAAIQGQAAIIESVHDLGT